MLIADPSSTCDVCLENFSLSKECWCIPCGHIFCRQCLSKLTQHTCPMCRASLNDASYISVTRPARKVHVDLSNCEGDTSARSHREHRSKGLKQRLAAETLDWDKFDMMSSVDLFREVHEFLRTESSNKYTLLRVIESLLLQLIALLVCMFEDRNMLRGVRASYEHRIKELEELLRAHTRHERSKTRGDPERHRSRMSTSAAQLQSSRASACERIKHRS